MASASRFTRIASAVGALLAAAGCANSKTEYKSNKEVLVPASGSNAALADPYAGRPIDVWGSVEIPATFAQFNYKVAIRTLLGIKVCDVNAVIHISAAPFGFRVPAGKLKCLLGLYELDLASMLATMSAGSNPNASTQPAGPKIVDGLRADGPMAMATAFNGAMFFPQRPLFLVPFSLNPAELATYNRRDPATMTDLSNGRTANGTFVTKVKSFRGKYTPEAMPQMNDVFTFEIAAEDFKIDGVQNPLFGLFEYYRFGINLNAPVAITEAEIKGNLRQFLTALSGAQDGLLGIVSGWVPLRAQLDLVSQVGLNSSSP